MPAHRVAMLPVPLEWGFTSAKPYKDPGNEVTLDVVRDDLRDRLKKVKVGDLLKVTLTEAIAVNVRARPQ